MGDEVRVLIADDHPIVRKGLREVMEADRALIVVDEVDRKSTRLNSSH